MRRDLIFIALLAAATNFAFLVASNRDYTFPDSATYLTPRVTRPDHQVFVEN